MSVAARQLLRAARLSPEELITQVKGVKEGELCHHLAKRFYNHAEHFFPPQMVQTMEAFGRSGYAGDAYIDAAFIGRLDDITANCGTRRLVQLLRAASVLRIEPLEEWWPTVVEPLCIEHVKNIVEGIPTMVDALSELPDVDYRVGALLEGFRIQLECAPGVTPAIFSKSLERLSRVYKKKGLNLDPLRDHAYGLMKDSKSLHSKDRLNLLTAFERLNWEAPAPLLTTTYKSTADDIDDLHWQAQLLFRTPLETTKNRIEAHVKGLKKPEDRKYVWHELPHDALALAQLGESSFVSYLLAEPSIPSSGVVKKYSAQQHCALVRAAALSECTSNVQESMDILDRLYPQLTLMERRQVHEVAVLADHKLKHEPVTADRLFLDQGQRQGLNRNDHDASVDTRRRVGSVTIFADDLRKDPGMDRGWRPISPGDVFSNNEPSPAQKLRERYMKRKGFTVEHREV